jgi:hypothetical protein
MRMVHGDFNVYWFHVSLTPYAVRAACYGDSHNSGGLLPEVEDVINDFPGLDGDPIRVRVMSVTHFGQGVRAYEVRVTDL